MRCPRHPERTASAACAVCGTWSCPECLTEAPGVGGAVCPLCLPAARAERPRPRSPLRGVLRALLLLAVPLASAALAALLVRPGPDELARARLGAAYGALESTALALQAHRAARGGLPDRLDELVPAYLPALPEDPFGDGPLRYGAPPGDPRARVLYSVGPDGLDQGGAPWDPTTGRGDLPCPVR